MFVSFQLCETMKSAIIEIRDMRGSKKERLDLTETIY